MNQAIGLLRELEEGSPAVNDLTRWQQRLGDGHAQFRDISSESRVFPPLFLWIVGNAHDEPGEGFRQAAEIYRRRATYRMEAFLYSVLPVSVIVVGLVIFLQVSVFVIVGFLPMMQMGGGLGS